MEIRIRGLKLEEICKIYAAIEMAGYGELVEFKN